MAKSENENVYFPHYVNARNDRKIRRVRKELGVEGYGIFYMLLEVLREQSDLKYPLEDIDLLAEDFGTSEQKIRVVICNYKLFEVDKDQLFFSPKQIEYLQPYFAKSNRAKHAALVRWNKEDANAMQMHSNGNANAMQAKQSKGNQRKEKNPLSFLNFLEIFGTDKKHIVRKFTLNQKKSVVWHLLEPLGYTKQEAATYWETIHDRNYVNPDGDPYTMEFIYKEVKYYHSRGWIKREAKDD